MTEVDLSPGLPAPDHLGAGSAPERATRKPLAPWDRLKFLVLLVGLYWFFVWSDYADPNPLNDLGDAVAATNRSKWFLFVLFGMEVVRQLHYLVAERHAGYHRFWSEKVFGRWEARLVRMDDWNRYRAARAAKVVVGLVVVSVVLGTMYDRPPVLAALEAPRRLWEWLPLVIQLLFGFVFVIVQFVGLFWFLSRGGTEVYMPDDIKTRFTDVWGQDAVLERVKENVVFLEAPERIEEKGGYVPQGILLWGPPGTGKTLMAEAVAGETGRPFVFVDPGAFTNMFMGVGILKVKGLFRKLRKLAVRYGGVIVFFDEADSLGNRGALTPGPFGGQAGARQDPWAAEDHLRWLSPESQAAVLRSNLVPSALDVGPGRVRDRIMMGGMAGGGGMGTLQALLSEISGLKKPRGFLNRYVRRLFGMRPKPPPKFRILVMMATNMPQSLDEALLRPGRIDRMYKVGYPSKDGRRRTYEGYFAKVHHELTGDDVEKLATITPYATGATIKDLVNESLIIAIREGRDTITWNDVIRAKHLKELGPPEDVEYIERERHAIAVHEACHAVAAYRVRKHLSIDLATIEKGGSYLGMVSSIKPEDQFTRWRTEYEADVLVSLASLAGERLFFEGDNSSGVSGDLESATTIATLMEGYWGMGTSITSHGVTHQVGIRGGGRPGAPGEQGERELLADRSLGERIETRLDALLGRARDLLDENRSHVLALAHALESHKTLSGDDVVAVIEGRPGPAVDGRPYHDPVVRSRLEEYHEAAVGAHAHHAALTLPLPSLNGHHPRLAADAVAFEEGEETAPRGQAPAGIRFLPPPAGPGNPRN